MPNPKSPIIDDRVFAVIDRLQATRQPPPNGGPLASGGIDPYLYADHGFSIHPPQGDLIYLLCRSIRAGRVVEFATSVGMSTLYFAAAVRDNGGGIVIGSELVPSKIAVARRNLTDAGLVDMVEIREGDARETLRDLGEPVDFVLIDGWPANEKASLAMQVMRIVAPQIRLGGLVMNDNGEADYLDFVRDPKSGFLSISLPLKGSTELSVKVS